MEEPFRHGMSTIQVDRDFNSFIRGLEAFLEEEGGDVTGAGGDGVTAQLTQVETKK